MCLYRKYFEELERISLAPYAVRSIDPKYYRRRTHPLQYKEVDLQNARFASILKQDRGEQSTTGRHSQGNVADEYGDESRYRTAFMIDCGRIMSSKCFRRMEHKTQIFVSHVGDHYRTRLTHTLEVEGIAQQIARALRLNTDLVRAIALAHDVGHTPSGHFGATTLDTLFGAKVGGGNHEKSHGRFFHNIHGLRVVDFLEKGYEWDFTLPSSHSQDDPVKAYLNADVEQAKGLDLTWAVREGILKHTRHGLDELAEGGLVGYDYLLHEGFDLRSPGTLETQVVRWADDLASLMHDLEDGMRSGILSPYALVARIREWGSDIFATEKLMEHALGMSEQFGHHGSLNDSENSIRTAKFTSAYRAIFGEEGNEGRKKILKYNIVAFLRSVFMANLIEQSHYNIGKVLNRKHHMGGLGNLTYGNVSSSDFQAALEELMASSKQHEDELLELVIRPPSGDHAGHVCVSAIHRYDGPTVARETRDFAIVWINKHEDPRVPQLVEITLNGTTEVWPVGNVFIDLSQISVLSSSGDESAASDNGDLIGYTKDIDELRNKIKQLVIKRQLHNSMSVQRMDHKGKFFLEALFGLFAESPEQLPVSSFEHYGLGGMTAGELKANHPDAFYLRIVENLQGMTERFLEEEYSRLFLPGKSTPLSAEQDLGDYIDPRLLASS